MKYKIFAEKQRYFLEIAESEIQIFYLKRKLENQEEFFKEWNPFLGFVKPLQYGVYEERFYVLYPMIDKIEYVKDFTAYEKLNDIYSSFSLKTQMDMSVRKRLEWEFLSSFPQQFHAQITSMKLYKKYFEELEKEPFIYINKEHGDYTTNNLLYMNGKIYLMDFEFARDYQVIGFDLYDYYMSTGCAVENIPYFHLHSIKYKLINEINHMIDESEKPQVSIVLGDKKENMKKINPDFIYNRLDLRYKDKTCELIKIVEHDKEYYIPIVFFGQNAKIGVWLTTISAWAFCDLIDFIYSNYNEIETISIEHSLNYYPGLKISNHWKVELPDSEEYFIGCLSKTTRKNIKWFLNRLEKNYKWEIMHLKGKEITEALIERYFELKKITHGTNYNMTAQKYIEDYYVTDAYVLLIEENEEAIIFFSILGEYVYVENLTYNIEFRKYSIGTVLYYISIINLINSHKKWIFLGDGWLEYKRRFGGINQVTYCGCVQSRKNRNHVIHIKNIIIERNVKKCILYGYGELGKSIEYVVRNEGMSLVQIVDKKEYRNYPFVEKEIRKYEPDVYVIIGAINKRDEIRQICLAKEYDEYHIITLI